MLNVPLEGMRVLAVGCGDGGELLRPEFAGTKIVGLDFDASLIAKARAALPHVEFHVGKAQELPFADGSFDFVYGGVVYPYTPIRPAFAEAARVLANDGYLFTTLHDEWQQRQWLKEAWQKGRWKRVIDHGYIYPGSAIYNLTGINVPRPWSPSTYESFQTIGRACKDLRSVGFKVLRAEKVHRVRDGKPWRDFVIEAVKA